MFQILSDPQLLTLAAAALLIFYIGYKIGRVIQTARSKKQFKAYEQDQNKFQKQMKKVLDGENEDVASKNVMLQQTIQRLEDRLEDYRKKIAGMGILNISSSNKKRSDILYSLILENETLEQLLFQQSSKFTEQAQDHLQHKLMDIKKRQRLMSEVFNDDTIKNYVKEVIEQKEEIPSTEKQKKLGKNSNEGNES